MRKKCLALLMIISICSLVVPTKAMFQPHIDSKGIHIPLPDPLPLVRKTFVYALGLSSSITGMAIIYQSIKSLLPPQGHIHTASQHDERSHSNHIGTYALSFGSGIAFITAGYFLIFAKNKLAH